MPTPLPTLSGVYYGYVYGSYLGRRCGSVFTFKETPGETDPANDALKAQYIADGLAISWDANMRARMPLAWSGTDSRCYALGHATIPPAFGHVSGAGSNSGDVAATAAAAVIRHNVFRRGRGSQSHTAISPLLRAELTSDGTSVTGAFITNMNTDFGDFIAGVQAHFTTATGGSTVAYVQLSKKGSGATYAITGSATEALLGTERSRTARP